MKITGGKYRGALIEAPRGRTTRPALSRVRRALFDTLRPWIEGGRVLDLFAGSGAFVLEALSRGAQSAIAIDLDRAAVRAIRGNAKTAGVKEPLEVFCNDALAAIPVLARRRLQFEVVLVAPPYWKDLQSRALAALDATALVDPGGVVVVQRDRAEAYAAPVLERLVCEREKRYGNTVIELYRPRSVEGTNAPQGEPS
jgi:16S rRNA (guanine(966)-N(2))-methyltransferase RsmD